MLNGSITCCNPKAITKIIKQSSIANEPTKETK